MPKIVDHDQRRAELAHAAWRVIIANGLDGTTTREIARESGYSAGVLSHYFQSKDDLLLEALRRSHAVILRRLGELAERHTGLTALRMFCYDSIPLHDEQVRETYLEMSFWSRALVNAELREVQRSEAGHWRGVLRRLVVGAQESGELRREDPDLVMDMLASLIDGISVHALLYPERITKSRLVEMMDHQLALWSVSRDLP